MRERAGRRLLRIRSRLRHAPRALRLHPEGLNDGVERRAARRRDSKGLTLSRALERVRKPCGLHMRALQHCIGLRESRQAVDQGIQALANLRKLRAAHLRRAGAEITISQTHMDGEQLLDALCQIARRKCAARSLRRLARA